MIGSAVEDKVGGRGGTVERPCWWAQGSRKTQASGTSSIERPRSLGNAVKKGAVETRLVGAGRGSIETPRGGSSRQIRSSDDAVKNPRLVDVHERGGQGEA